MTRKTGKISVGLIGANKRALWYGAIFDNIDPSAYARLDPFNYHHMTIYMHVELRAERAHGFRLVKVYDPDASAARTTADAFRSKPEVCAKLEHVSRNVDLVFIANESGDGMDHPKLARPGLSKGVPTFIDRPLAATVKDAKSLIALARRRHAALMSCSHLRMMPHTARFKSRFAELDKLELGMVQGIGPDPALMADGIELAVFLFGDEFGGRAECVQSMGSWPLEVMHVRFSKRTGRVLQALIHNSDTHTTRRTFYARAMARRLPVDSPDLEAFRQVEGGRMVMNALKDMVRTGKSPISARDMIEPIAIAEAGRKAHNKARPVMLKSVR